MGGCTERIKPEASGPGAAALQDAGPVASEVASSLTVMELGMAGVMGRLTNWRAVVVTTAFGVRKREQQATSR